MKARITFFAVFFFVLALTQVSHAQTISGPLSGTLGPGNYYVIGAISVEQGATLRFMPGTTFWFTVRVPFQIDGVLLAEGTATDSIIFTTNPALNPILWEGVDFSGVDASNSRISYCRIRYSVSSGVSCSNSSSSFVHCTISGNSASSGGGVYLNASSPSFSNCTITGNSATGIYGGGGVDCRSSSPSFTNCTISGNSVDYGGGGVVCASSSPSFTNCTINGNSASYGGGVSCYGSSPTFTNCTLSGNSASSVGGVYCDSSSPSIRNSIIAFSQGSGIFFAESSGSQVQYCDIFGNSGGNIAFAGGDPSQGTPVIGWTFLTNANGDPADIYMNIFQDPLFVDAAGGNFHLTNASHCIGPADPTNYPQLDAEGNPRPNPAGSNPDIGAYESPIGTPGGVVPPNVGYVELVHFGLPNWDYRLHHVSGSLSRLVFRNFCAGTIGSVSGEAVAHGWSAANYADSIVFTTGTPLTSGAIATFRLSHPSCSDQITWTAGDSTGTVDGPLPVELSSFTATCADNKITLNWATASETNASRFDLLRDGSLVGSVAAANEAHNYTWTDTRVLNGTTYSYTLELVNVNGGRESLRTIEATPRAGIVEITDYALHQNYPNPFNPVTRIEYDLKEAGFVTLKVFNLLGQEIAVLVNDQRDKGRFAANFNASGLPSGVYLYRIEANGFMDQKKMVLMK
jgi:hypothetical protein